MNIENINFYELTGNNEIDNVKEYLLKGGDINCSNGRALVYPVMNGHLDMVELLLQNGININAVRDSYNALEWSVVCNQLSVFKLLLDKGAKTSPENNRNKPLITLILSYIAQDKYIEVIECALSKGIDINEVDCDGKNALFYALQHNDLKVIKYLIDRGIDMYKIDNNNKNILFYALQYNNVKMIRYFSNRNLDISPYKYELMKDIIYHNKIEVLSIIHRNYTLNLDIYDEQGDTPLIYSIRANNIEMVQYLLLNCNINKATLKYQNTPLMIAVQYQHIECVKLLLQKGADVLMENASGWTAFNLCNNSDIEILLQEYLDCY